MSSSPSEKSGNSSGAGPTRQERRAEKLRRKKERMPVHGKGLGKIYENAVRKRTKRVDKQAN
jgi:hypothetical protein